MHRHIGVFDSGFGGLEVLRSLTLELSTYSFIYLADTARSPYGDRTPAEISQFTQQAIDFLKAHECELIVLACNSASCHTSIPLGDQTNADQPTILGVPDSCSTQAAAVTQSKRIGVLATAATVASGVYARQCQAIDPSIQVFQQACPELVPLIEAGKHTSEVFQTVLKHYLKVLQANHIDTIILGCTHYGLVADQIKAIAPETHVVVAGETTSQYLASFLKDHPELERKLAHTSQRQFYSTKPSDHFNTLASEFFGSPVEATQATLEENTH